MGSPPRVREKRVFLETVIIYSRITPACAGKTVVRLQKTLRDRDHPRVCGKNPPARSSSVCPLGSPPRVREKRIKSLTKRRRTGITPACAGKTAVVGCQLSPLRDHPRVCGKNFKKFVFMHLELGSPPRVREKRGLFPRLQS